MKTHDMAKALSELAKMLRSLPNTELSDVPDLIQGKSTEKTAEIAVSLSSLASLAAYGKAEWVSVIQEFDLPIEVRPRDAARDVLGKLLTYLEGNKSARIKLSEAAQSRSKSSNEVSSALKFLLRDE
ncbi:hypothetical protein HLM50_19335 [Sulfitobacter sp. Ks41]|uniref:hypothetical protein n=1 Tax=Sulfitobacter sp. Ks41 TaxID=2731139 RepID=UPI0023E257E3|nr:hypothetical protein [Sulfitobacter sp. Ks41]MDF3363193.1 hypothetical protein [Sulfitobacter sp. Ks41]